MTRGPNQLNAVAEQDASKHDVIDITIALVNYNTGFLFDRLFSAISAAKGSLRLQTLLVDNASRDDSVELLRRKYPFVEVIQNSANVGFGRANNQTLTRMRGRYLLLLNTDAFVSPDTLVKTFVFMEQNPDCGILGAKLVGEDRTLQPSCRYFPTPWNVFLAANGLGRYFPWTRQIDDMNWDHQTIRQCDWIPGCYYLVRRALLDQVGLFDPRFFLYYEEVDHCRRARQAGWKVTYYADTEVVHIGGESAKSDTTLTSAGRQIARLQAESELLYFRKHFGLPGVIASIALTACGATFSLVKDALRPTRPGAGNAQREKLATQLSLLAPTDWGSRPTR
jgi:N-acetylglucosaminyl-diphospho-decaprenol L-rhamnosyltransferase